MRSVLTTVLASTAVILVIVGISGTVVAYVMGRDESNFVFDGLLAQMALHVEPETHAVMPWPAYDDPEDEVVIQVWDTDGRPIRGGAVAIPRQTASGFATLLIDGTPWRTFVAHGGGRTVQVSQRQEVRDEVAEQLAISAGLPIAVALPVVWVVVAFALVRLFRQLDTTSKAVATRSVEATQPLPREGVPTEMTSFVDAINQLLRRQAEAIEQQRRFVSDAAHELRTPLTALQILADTLAMHAEKGAADDGLARDFTRATGRARSLVSQLLTLADVDARREEPAVRRVEMRTVLLEVVAGLVAVAERRHVAFSVRADETADVIVSPVDLTTLFSVLADNAVRYSPAHSIVDVRLASTRWNSVVAICDRGSGIAPEALPHIYDRFFRAAPQHVEGSGLGLAIARAIADRYGFTLAIANRPGGGVVATVTFPHPQEALS